jgi:hypothetical protein
MSWAGFLRAKFFCSSFLLLLGDMSMKSAFRKVAIAFALSALAGSTLAQGGPGYGGPMGGPGGPA